MQEIRVQSLGREDPREKGMAAHSSILAGEFHGQKSLVGYSQTGQRVRHDWATITLLQSLNELLLIGLNDT